MSAAATESAPAPAPAKKGGALKLIIAVVVAAAAAGGGAFFFASKKAAKPATESSEGAADEHAAAAEGHDAGHDSGGHGDAAPKAASSDYFALQPAFVVNLNDDEAMRFLQIELEVAAPKVSTQEAVKLATPLIRNRLMLLFSSQRYHELLAREGKEKLQRQALDEINKVLDEQKKPHISNVVFTSFVMQ